jgi:hypothetical protein
MLAVLPHELRILIPFEMQANCGNAKDIFPRWIGAYVVLVTSLGRSLDVKADRRRITPLDFALERPAKPSMSS